jgi:hypothetical protein
MNALLAMIPVLPELYPERTVTQRNRNLIPRGRGQPIRAGADDE